MSEYVRKVSSYLAGAAITYALALAKEVGIAKVLLEEKEPVTSDQVAEKLDMKERYVREVLRGLAAGEVIEVDETATKFWVPEDKKKDFERMSILSLFPLTIGEKHDDVAKCFPNSGPFGTRYSKHERFFNFLEEAEMIVNKDWIDTDILPAVEGLAEKLQKGIKVVEFGSGSGTFLNKLAARFPNSTFEGADVAESALEIARANAAKQNLKNVTHVACDLNSLPASMKNTYDWAICKDTVHDLPDPPKSVAAIYECLKPGGIFSMIDFAMKGSPYEDRGNPTAAMFYCASIYHCIPESFQNPDSLAYGVSWGAHRARETLKAPGFTLINEKPVSANPCSAHFVGQK